MSKKTITDETRERLRNCGLTMMQVKEKSGIGYHWLTKFSSGAIKNPTVDRLFELKSFLDQQESRAA